MWLQRSIKCLVIAVMLFTAIYTNGETFKGDMEGIPVSFNYPDNWQLRHSQGKSEKYYEIYIQGPRDKLNNYNVSLSITKYPMERYNSLKDLMDDYEIKHANFKGYKLLYPGEKDKPELEIEYMLNLPLYSAKAKDVKIRERVFFLKKNNNYFKLKFSALENDYSTYLPTYHTLIETFQ